MPEKIEITRRTAIATLSAATACLCGCEIRNKPEVLITNLPYADPEESPYGPPPKVIKEEEVVVPPTVKKEVATEVGQVIPRSAWTTAGPDLKNVQPMNGVKLITFHHSGDGKPFTATETTAVAKHIEAVRQYHRQRGMVDIGYHFAIDGAGRIWQLRELKYEGQHVRISTNGTRWNEHNLGIVVLGDFEKQVPTAASKQRMTAFAKFLLGHYNLPATAVHYHGELVQTTCPGSLGTFVAAMRKTL